MSLMDAINQVEKQSSSPLIDAINSVEKKNGYSLSSIMDKVEEDYQPTPSEAYGEALTLQGKAGAQDKPISDLDMVPGTVKGQVERNLRNFGAGTLSAIHQQPEVFYGFIQEFAEKAGQKPDITKSEIGASTMFGGPLASYVKERVKYEIAKRTDIDEKIAGWAKSKIQENQKEAENIGLVPQGENFSDTLVFGLGSGVVSLGEAMAITALSKDPKVGSIIAGSAFGAMQKSSWYQEARQNGVDARIASNLSTVAGLLEGMIEQWGIEGLINKTTGPIALRAIKGSIIEGSEELMQEIAGQGLAKITYDNKRKWKNIIKDAGLSGLIGGILGAPGGIGGSAIREGKKDAGEQLGDAKISNERIVEGPSGVEAPLLKENVATAMVRDEMSNLGVVDKEVQDKIFEMSGNLAKEGLAESVSEEVVSDVPLETERVIESPSGAEAPPLGEKADTEVSPITQAMDEVEGVAEAVEAKPTPEQSLEQEALKYKSVEEFVESQRIKPEVFYTNRNIEIIKNPSNNEIRQLTKEARKEFPQGRNEPAIRTTYDEKGNEYIWRADKATHDDIETFIKKEFGLNANQNEHLLEKPRNFIGKNIDAIVTKSAKEKGKWQTTFYDKKGIPNGDTIRDTYEEAINEARYTTGILSGEDLYANKKFEQMSTQQLTAIYNEAHAGKPAVPAEKKPVQETPNKEAKKKVVKRRKALSRIWRKVTLGSVKALLGKDASKMLREEGLWGIIGKERKGAKDLSHWLDELVEDNVIKPMPAGGNPDEYVYQQLKELVGVYEDELLDENKRVEEAYERERENYTEEELAEADRIAEEEVVNIPDDKIVEELATDFPFGANINEEIDVSPIKKSEYIYVPKTPVSEKPDVKPKPAQKGEKVHGLSKSIMKIAIEKGLAEEFGDLPTSAVRHQKGDLAERIADFIEKDRELAKKIALEEAPEQDDIRSQELFKSLVVLAVKERDTKTIEELAKSETASAIAKEYGQRIQALDTGLSNDPVKVIRGIIKSRQESKEFKGRERELKILKIQLSEIEKKLAEREKQIERISKKEINRAKRAKFGETNRIFTKKIYDEAQASLRARLSVLSAGVDPTALIDLTKIGGFYFEGGLREFRIWSKTLINEFGIKVKPYLRKAWHSIKRDFDNQEASLKQSINTLKDIRKQTNNKNVGSLEKRIERTIKSLEKRIAEYERRIEEKDFSSMRKKGEQISSPQIDELRKTLKMLQEEYKSIKPTTERTNEQRVKAFVTRITNETKRLQNSLDTLNFEKKVRKKTILDAEHMQLLAERDRKKLAVSAAQVVGEEITSSEVAKIVDFVKEMNDARDQIEESGDETASNEKNVMKYWEKRGEFEEYVESLKPVKGKDIVNNIIDYQRAAILASPRILKNSFLYQIVPGIERTITKRIVTGVFDNADMKNTIMQKLIAKIHGVAWTFDKESLDFAAKQVWMAMRIYHKTGYDVSRMDKIGSSSKYYGEKAGRIKGKGVFSKIGRAVLLAPKWLAGGTDTLFANIGKADTSIMHSREVAKIEELTGNLPEGVTMEERAHQLLLDSYTFDPKDKRASDIRERGKIDAHMMNNTQPGAWSDAVIDFRRLGKKYTGVDFGKVIIPFAKIANVVIAEGTKTATGFGIAEGIVKIQKASRIESSDNRAILMSEGVNNLIRYVGFTGAALFIAGLLDDDDYIGAWDTIGRKDYSIARARGAGTNYIRIAGKWIPLRYLPIINIPISAIMTARQAKSRGGDPTIGYLSGMVGQILAAPGIKESKDILKKVGWAVRSKDKEKALNSLGLDGKSLWNWAKVRMIPSVLSYDVYNAVFKKDSKYDFLGREIQKGGVFRDDKTNDIILEISRLHKSGKGPVISDPKNKEAVELEEKMGNEKYQDYLASLKKNYAKKLEYHINTFAYKRLNDKKKKSLIDRKRDIYIINKIKIKNRNMGGKSDNRRTSS